MPHVLPGWSCCVRALLFQWRPRQQAKKVTSQNSCRAAAPFAAQELFASDASSGFAAFCATSIDPDLGLQVWLAAGFKGESVLLERGSGSQVPHADGEPGCSDSSLLLEDSSNLSGDGPVPKPLHVCFDCIEVCGGAGGVSGALQRRGFHTGLDLSRSSQYDVTSRRLQDWICNLLQSGRLRSVMLEPPCTTFSAAAHPACRSCAVPLGFDRSDPKTYSGNAAAFACFIIFIVAVPCLFGATKTFKNEVAVGLALDPWRPWSDRILARKLRLQGKVPKGIRPPWLCLEMQKIHGWCPGRHARVKIEGSVTKESAVYHPRVAAAFARVLAGALTRQPPAESPPRSGLESVAVNELLLSRVWSVGAAWSWQEQAHINARETKAALRVFQHAVRKGGSLRFFWILPSRGRPC